VCQSFGFHWLILTNIIVHQVISSSLSVLITDPVFEFYFFDVFNKYSLPWSPAWINDAMLLSSENDHFDASSYFFWYGRGSDASLLENVDEVTEERVSDDDVILIKGAKSSRAVIEYFFTLPHFRGLLSGNSSLVSWYSFLVVCCFPMIQFVHDMVNCCVLE